MSSEVARVSGGRNRGRRVNADRNGSFDRIMADEIYSQIRYWYGEGLTDTAVALKVGCADRTVLRYRQRHGFPPNGNWRG